MGSGLWSQRRVGSRVGSQKHFSGGHGGGTRTRSEAVGPTLQNLVVRLGRVCSRRPFPVT
eukprot:2395291-Prymnesium_polylepis.1